MQTLLKYVPIEIIFVFLTNYLSESIKNPSSARAKNLKPILEQTRNLVDVLLAKLNSPAQ